MPVRSRSSASSASSASRADRVRPRSVSISGSWPGAITPPSSNVGGGSSASAPSSASSASTTSASAACASVSSAGGSDGSSSAPRSSAARSPCRSAARSRGDAARAPSRPQRRATSGIPFRIVCARSRSIGRSSAHATASCRAPSESASRSGCASQRRSSRAPIGERVRFSTSKSDGRPSPDGSASRFVSVRPSSDTVSSLASVRTRPSAPAASGYTSPR